MKKKIALLILLILFLTPIIILFIRSKDEELIQQEQLEESISNEEIKETLTDEERAENMGDYIANSYTSTYEKRYEENIEIYSESTSIVEEFIYQLNEGNFEEAYNMLSEDYIDDTNYSYDEFKQEYNFSGSFKTISIQSYEKVGDISIIETVLSDFNMDCNVDNESNKENDPVEQIYIVDAKNKISKGTEQDYIKVTSNNEIIGLDRLYSRMNIDIDEIKEIKKDIQTAFDMAKVIAKESNKGMEIEEYYIENSTNLFEIFGIKSFEEFESFEGKISKINDTKNVQGVIVNFVKSGNNIFADLIIYSTPKEKTTLNFKLVNNYKNNKIENYLYIR